MMTKIDEVKRINREEGITGVFKATRDYMLSKARKISPVHASTSHQLGRISGNKKRWEMIKPHLKKEDKTLLDIGCDAGVLTKLAADEGMFSIGIDKFPKKNKASRENVVKIFKGNQKVGFVRFEVTPENIDSLPRFDVVFLLSVYHHWHREFGEESAKKMLRSLKGTNTNKIFFEPASRKSDYIRKDNKNPPPIEDEDKASIIDYNTNMLESVFGEEYDVEYLGKSRTTSHYRHLFLIKK